MHLANGEVPVRRGILPEGEEGVDETVDRMVRMAHGQYGTKSAKVRALAINILNRAGIADKDYYGMIIAIHNFVRDHVRYIRDPLGQETISHPEETLFNTRAGDCDDKVIAEIALLGSLGIQSWPVVVGRQPGNYSHVYLKAVVPPGRHRHANEVIPLDPIMREWPAGREAPLPYRKEYKQYSAGNTDMSGLGFLGAYASAPDYSPGNFTTEEVELMSGQSLRPEVAQVPGTGPQTMTREVQASSVIVDGRPINSVQVESPMEGIDGMFGLGNVLPPSGAVSAETRIPMEKFGPPPGAREQIGSRYTEFGQLRPKQVVPQEMPPYKYGSYGPVTLRGQQLTTRYLRGPAVEQVSDQQQALGRRGAAGVRSRGAPIVEVRDRKIYKAPKKAGKHLSQEVEELEGLSGAIRSLAGELQLAGLGADIGKGLDQVLEETASMSWLATEKRKLMTAVRQHFERLRKHLKARGAQPETIAKAQDQEEAAKEVEKAAVAVEKQAKDLEKKSVADPRAAAAIENAKRALTKAENGKDPGSRIDDQEPAEAVMEAEETDASMEGLGRWGRTRTQEQKRPQGWGVVAQHVAQAQGEAALALERRRLKQALERKGRAHTGGSATFDERTGQRIPLISQPDTSNRDAMKAQAAIDKARMRLQQTMQRINDYVGIQRAAQDQGYPAAAGIQAKLRSLQKELNALRVRPSPVRSPQVVKSQRKAEIQSARKDPAIEAEIRRQQKAPPAVMRARKPVRASVQPRRRGGLFAWFRGFFTNKPQTQPVEGLGALPGSPMLWGLAAAGAYILFLRSNSSSRRR